MKCHTLVNMHSQIIPHLGGKNGKSLYLIKNWKILIVYIDLTLTVLKLHNMYYLIVQVPF